MGIGVVCSLIANAPSLIENRVNPLSIKRGGRLVGLLSAQIVLFAGYCALIAYLRHDGQIETLLGAGLLGGLFGSVPALMAPRGSWAAFAKRVILGFAIVVGSVAAFFIAPTVWAR
jgi:hypothetical protein